MALHIDHYVTLVVMLIWLWAIVQAHRSVQGEAFGPETRRAYDALIKVVFSTSVAMYCLMHIQLRELASLHEANARGIAEGMQALAKLIAARH